MSRQIHVFHSPERFLAGTIGRPGEREFFLQAVDGSRVVSVACEKQQVMILADRLGALITEVGERFGSRPEGAAGTLTDGPLVTPLDAEFRVGTMGLAWDGGGARVIVELLALTDEEISEDLVLEDRDDAPDALRVFLTLVEAQGFAVQAQAVVAAGRPPCPLCGNPLDEDGHICPRLNGYRRTTPR